jgi:hypothetical protein
MQLNEFLEKFLPEYEKRHRLYVLNRGNFETEDQRVEFIEDNFPEAIQNFADRICEKQREICAEYYSNNVPYEQKENWMYNNILESKQPKIDEL